MQTMKPKHMPRVSGASGFTLIELMIVVAVVAILGTVAISGYINSVRKSRRTEARTALLDLASREERFMSTNSAYSSTPSDLGYSGSLPLTVGSGYYQISIPVLNAATSAVPATFTLTATAVTGKGQDKDLPCRTFSVDSTGNQSATDSLGAVATSTCWN
jgi:type IV pilus assembly protein PilE